MYRDCLVRSGIGEKSILMTNLTHTLYSGMSAGTLLVAVKPVRKRESDATKRIEERPQHPP